MIADEIGVTKAAVYHQYKTKDEIVLAAAESELGRLEAVVEVAETESSPSGHVIRSSPASSTSPSTGGVVPAPFSAIP